MSTAPSVDPAEVERFSRLAEAWWDPTGEFAPLHKFNPARLAAIRRTAVARFARDPAALRPFAGLTVLDIGCGGGLVCEPMARLGAAVTGVDPSATNIGVAKLHAEASGLAIDYRATTAEALAEARETFDLVLCLEVVEHVTDVDPFLATCAALVRPGGLLVVATINRTLKAFALAIVGAEYVLRWLPRGTHAYEKLVRPDEAILPLERAGLDVIETVGLVYDPLSGRWSESGDVDVNYMLFAGRP
jgi:2-polyprenyl-6-hydroxyphenyl methylase/3-demethylubiquinone-9 3-methyltransferase